MMAKMLDNFKCGDYVFNANFDSGNLQSVELVHLLQGECYARKAWHGIDLGGEFLTGKAVNLGVAAARNVMPKTNAIALIY